MASVFTSPFSPTCQGIWWRLCALSIIENQGNWVPYDLKLIDAERGLFACSQLLQRPKRKGLVQCVIMTKETWVLYHDPNQKSHRDGLIMVLRRFLSRIFTLRTIRCLLDGTKSVFPLRAIETERKHQRGIVSTKAMQMNGSLLKRCVQYDQKHKQVILQDDKARPHIGKPVKTYLGAIKWEAIPQPPYFADIAPADYHLFHSIAWPG